MSVTNMFIPRRIKVGYQNRDDTYTGQLAYLIYFDEKGKLRKETSWNNWRDKKIPPAEYDNEPTGGFVLNKKVGGYCNHWSDFRQAYVRVYDPRGFEFEITVPNLLYILENTNCIKGKGLEGKFVYGWDGTDLVLVPCSSPDYAQLEELNKTRFASKKVFAKNLKIGGTYLAKTGVMFVYLGKYDFYNGGYIFDGQFFETFKKMQSYCKKTGKEYVVRGSGRWDRESLYKYGDGLCGKRYFFSRLDDGMITPAKDVSWIIDTISEECAADYAERFEKLEHNTWYSPYDETKDVKVHYDFADFEAHNRGGYTHILKADYDGSERQIQIFPMSGGKYRVRNGNYSTNFHPEELFVGKVGRFGWEMEPVELSDIFEKFDFFYVEQHLQNGKFYRRVY